MMVIEFASSPIPLEVIIQPIWVIQNTEAREKLVINLVAAKLKRCRSLRRRRRKALSKRAWGFPETKG